MDGAVTAAGPAAAFPDEAASDTVLMASEAPTTAAAARIPEVRIGRIRLPLFLLGPACGPADMSPSWGCGRDQPRIRAPRNCAPPPPPRKDRPPPKKPNRKGPHPASPNHAPATP